jgi:EmrB/QacA subfamily drug resistance transporter
MLCATLAPMNRNDTVSFSSSPDPRRWWVLVVLSASLLVIGLDNTILNVALPTLQSELGSTGSQLQWIVDAYMLVFAGLLLTAGALGDRFGRKRALAFGLTVFGLGSGLSALATSPSMLIATRALMGIGGAFIMPSTLSIITAVFPPDERPKAIGAWAAVSGLGIAIGPVAGGYLIEHASWHAIFLVNLPFVAAALIAGHFLIPESKDPAAPRLDLPGFALSIAGLTTLVWAIIEAPSRGWTDGTIVGAFAVAAAILAGFLAWELRAGEPMLDVRLFRNPRFSGASGAITFVFFALMGSMFFLTQYLQGVLGYSALEAGLRVSPIAVGLIIGGPVSAKLAARVGTNLVVAGGLVLVASGLMIATQFEVGTAYELVLAHLLVMGFGMGMAMAPATDSVMGSVPLEKASVGSAVNDTTRTTGGALGVAILGSLLASRYRGDMDDAVAGLPHHAADLAGDSLGGGLAIAHKLGSPELADAAHTAFVSGMHVAALGAAVVALAGAVIALVVIPGRERVRTPRLEPVPA